MDIQTLLIQVGSRRGYSVPLVLNQRGLLTAMYTDLAGNVGVGRSAPALKSYLPRRFAGRIMGLAARTVPEGVAAKTQTFDLIGILIWLNRFFPPHSSQLYRHRLLMKLLGKSMLRAGFKNANIIYSMFGEGDAFLREAKQRGLTVISEVYIALSAERIVEQERRAFVGWQKPSNVNYRSWNPNEALLRYTDFFICPSDFVKNDLIENFGVDSNAIRVVPYSCHGKLLTLVQNPEPKRILFAGTADLRKGIQYFAQAAERLVQEDPGYIFLVAGDVAASIKDQPACKALNFLGRIPLVEMEKEYLAADLLVLPTLAEGSAGVTYEALAAGIPIITTEAAGSIVQHGREGFIVPPRDVNALVNAIRAVVTNRTLRAKMALNARSRALEFSNEALADRLIKVMREAHFEIRR